MTVTDPAAVILKRPIILAAGGTGGHVFPALAVAAELLERGQRVTLATDVRGRRFLKDALPRGLKVVVLPAGRGGGSIFAKLAGVIKAGMGLACALTWFGVQRPAMVLGFGGYPTLPPLWAAWIYGIPMAIHEANAVMGKANISFRHRAWLVATSFAKTQGCEDIEAGRMVTTGTPVREAIAAIGAQPYPATQGQKLKILVIGGSQGAQKLAQIVAESVMHLPLSLRQNLRIDLQAPQDFLARAQALLRDSGVEGDVQTFFSDITERLTACHLVIARAGASSVAEIMTAGRPAIFVPYPHALRDEQSANVREAEAAGAAWVMAEASLTSESLAARLESLLGIPATLQLAASASRTLSHPHAARQLADMVERLGSVRVNAQGRAST
ncbi:MAG: UDP-N-acetylglucosamine--N-acetylmuramyl-(pentapeptide) pyrophosphoryl-undecaprenol N-acetylglucosamine transferase [Alphaproteobacteria bacterium]|nr:MAG: UDP-N-acetylglucosamine--N-acetylmuramyl-(pentapeptide) pyrophosphoryl-undecaprenol N-acetylglucosamine transferase [Alphaproteobacteria bacterium]